MLMVSSRKFFQREMRESANGANISQSIGVIRPYVLFALQNSQPASSLLKKIIEILAPYSLKTNNQGLKLAMKSCIVILSNSMRYLYLGGDDPKSSYANLKVPSDRCPSALLQVTACTNSSKERSRTPRQPGLDQSALRKETSHGKSYQTQLDTARELH